MVLPLAAILGVGSAIGGIAQGIGAARSAKAGQEGADQQLQVLQDAVSPYQDYGEQGMGAYWNALQAGPQLAGAGFSRQQMRAGRNALSMAMDQLGQDFQTSPGYQFALDEGQRAIEGSAAAQGGLYSGATMKALQDRAQGVASQEYNTWNNNRMNLMGALMGQGAQGQATLTGAQNQYMNRLAGVGDMGLNAAGMYSSGANQAIANNTNSQIAGINGVGNAINTTVGNALAGYGYLQQ